MVYTRLLLFASPNDMRKDDIFMAIFRKRISKSIYAAIEADTQQEADRVYKAWLKEDKEAIEEAINNADIDDMNVGFFKNLSYYNCSISKNMDTFLITEAKKNEQDSKPTKVILRFIYPSGVTGAYFVKEAGDIQRAFASIGSMGYDMQYLRFDGNEIVFQLNKRKVEEANG